MELTKEQIVELAKTYGKDEHDTGSAAVQVAILTHRINNLTAHRKTNIHDESAKRGLMILVGKRRRFLNYIDKKDHDVYLELIKKLGIRK